MPCAKARNRREETAPWNGRTTPCPSNLRHRTTSCTHRDHQDLKEIVPGIAVSQIIESQEAGAELFHEGLHRPISWFELDFTQTSKGQSQPSSKSHMRFPWPDGPGPASWRQPSPVHDPFFNSTPDVKLLSLSAASQCVGIDPRFYVSVFLSSCFVLSRARRSLRGQRDRCRHHGLRRCGASS